MKGFVLAFTSPDGDTGRAMMGHVCGRRHFGQAWNEAEHAYKIVERQQETRQRFDRFLTAAAFVRPHLQTLLPGLEERHQIREDLMAGAGTFMQHCADFCRSGGWVIQDKLEKRPSGGGTVVVQIRLHQIQGAKFFLQDTALRKTRDILLRLAGIEKLLQAEKPDETEIAARVRNVGDMHAILREVEQEAADGERALHAAHMEHLVRAVERAMGGYPSVRVANGRVQVLSTGGHWTTVYKTRSGRGAPSAPSAGNTI